MHELLDEPAGDVWGQERIADGHVADGGSQLAGPTVLSRKPLALARVASQTSSSWSRLWLQLGRPLLELGGCCLHLRASTMAA